MDRVRPPEGSATNGTPALGPCALQSGVDSAIIPGGSMSISP